MDDNNFIGSPTQVIKTTQSQSQEDDDNKANFTQRSYQKSIDHSAQLRGKLSATLSQTDSPLPTQTDPLSATQTDLLSSSLTKSEKQLIELTRQGARGRLRAEAILGEKLSGEAKRARLDKKQKSLKKRKVTKDSKVISDAVSVLFSMSQTKTKKKSQNVTPSAVQCHSVAKTKKISKNVTPSAVQCRPVTEKAFATPTSVSSTDKAFTTPSPAPSNQQYTRCDKCGFHGKDYHETKYRLFCFHGVMDYFDDVGFDFSDDLGVYIAYSKAYSAAIKKDTLDLLTFL